tara:strand:+ start:574 stop:747 length:174 start_codon:yes stop_codon:yes gene_type:complete
VRNERKTKNENILLNLIYREGEGGEQKKVGGRREEWGKRGGKRGKGMRGEKEKRQKR